MKKKLIVGNWKMNPINKDQAISIIKEIKKNVSKLKKTDVVLCPPFIYLQQITSLKNQFLVSAGAQDLFYKESGSFTGEISALMLKDLGVKYAIIGHSERRVMGENDELISQKVISALQAGLFGILCIGEKERDSQGEYLHVIKKQIENSLANMEINLLKKLIIAYEPVWAIGASEAMTPESIYEMTIFIKKVLSDLYGQDKIFDIPILYGGSVNSFNAKEIVEVGQVDGLLVGRESINPKGFGQLLKSVDDIEEDNKKIIKNSK